MNQKIVSTKEYKDVAEVAAKYVEALRIGNIEMLTDVFHKDAVTYCVFNGELMGGSGNPAIDFIKANGKSSAIESHIDVIDITPSTAVVRIVLENDASGADCNENLLLVRLNEGWTIVGKVFHQFGK